MSIEYRLGEPIESSGTIATEIRGFTFELPEDRSVTITAHFRERVDIGDGRPFVRNLEPYVRSYGSIVDLVVAASELMEVSPEQLENSFGGIASLLKGMKVLADAEQPLEA